LLEKVFERASSFVDASRVSDGQSCNYHIMEYLVPTQYVLELWYAIELLKTHDVEHKKKSLGVSGAIVDVG